MNILLGISGSVAATLTGDLIRGLRDLGEVRLVATQNGERFISLPTESLIGVTRYRDWDEWRWTRKGDPILHIELRNWADVYVIAPLSANTLAKIANGLCDNLLTNVARAWNHNKPFIVAPAMNTAMYEHPITKEQVGKLMDWNFCVIPPVEKELACGDFGVGAMASVADVVATTRMYLDGRAFRGP